MPFQKPVGILGQKSHHIRVIAGKPDKNRVVFGKNGRKRFLPPVIQFLEIGVFAFRVKQKVVVDLDHGWPRNFTGDIVGHRHMPDDQRVFMGIQSHGVFGQTIKVCSHHHLVRGLRQQKRQTGIAAAGGRILHLLFEKIVTVHRVGRKLLLIIIAVVMVFIFFINSFFVLPVYIFFFRESVPYFFIPKIDQLCGGRDAGSDRRTRSQKETKFSGIRAVRRRLDFLQKAVQFNYLIHTISLFQQPEHLLSNNF